MKITDKEFNQLCTDYNFPKNVIQKVIKKFTDIYQDADITLKLGMERAGGKDNDFYIKDQHVMSVFGGFYMQPCDGGNWVAPWIELYDGTNEYAFFCDGSETVLDRRAGEARYKTTSPDKTHMQVVEIGSDRYNPERKLKFSLLQVLSKGQKITAKYGKDKKLASITLLHQKEAKQYKGLKAKVIALLNGVSLKDRN